MFKLENGEQVVKTLRRHIFVMVPHLLFILLGALAPFLIYKFLVSSLLPIDTTLKNLIQNFIEKWDVFGYSLWLLLLWIVLFIEWTDYYLDMWVITDRRIIDVEQKGFFYREVTSFNYAQIQDITVDTKGVVQTVLKFGTLHVETAGDSRKIIIRDAHYPEDARILILRLQQKEKERIGDTGAL